MLLASLILHLCAIDPRAAECLGDLLLLAIDASHLRSSSLQRGRQGFGFIAISDDKRSFGEQDAVPGQQSTNGAA